MYCSAPLIYELTQCASFIAAHEPGLGNSYTLA
jgi:hypothetical protein